jgi:hypothetical protein
MKEKIKRVANWIKQNLGKVIVITCMVGLTLRDSDPFWVVLLILGAGTYLILTKPISKNFCRTISIMVWVAFFTVGGLIYYANHHLPHGPSYPTGEIVCQNGERCPCAEEYKEDLSNINIPNWAKFLKRSEGLLLFFGLGLVGVAISNKVFRGEGE